jgi:hypothetical protein
MSNLPIELSQLSAGLAKAVQNAPTSGSPFIKLDKSGDWIFGSDAYEVTDGLWAINPNSFIEGYIAWGVGELLGEEMAPMAGTPISVADLPAQPGAKRGWEKQVGLQMVALSGEFKGQQVVYKVSSKGGKDAIREMVVKVVSQINGGDSDIVPVVALESSSYVHKEYGKIMVPILAIDHWMSMDGVPDGESGGAAPEEEPKKAPTRRRRIAG